MAEGRLERIRDRVDEAMRQLGWDQMDRPTQAAAVAIAIDSVWHSLDDPSIDDDDWPGPPESEIERAIAAVPVTGDRDSKE